MLIDELLVNLSGKWFNLKYFVSQEGTGGTRLGLLAKGLGWEVSFWEEQAGGGGWVGVKGGWGQKARSTVIPVMGCDHQSYGHLWVPSPPPVRERRGKQAVLELLPTAAQEGQVSKAGSPATDRIRRTGIGQPEDTLPNQGCTKTVRPKLGGVTWCPLSFTQRLTRSSPVQKLPACTWA